MKTNKSPESSPFAGKKLEAKRQSVIVIGDIKVEYSVGLARAEGEKVTRDHFDKAISDTPEFVEELANRWNQHEELIAALESKDKQITLLLEASTQHGEALSEMLKLININKELVKTLEETLQSVKARNSKSHIAAKIEAVLNKAKRNG